MWTRPVSCSSLPREKGLFSVDINAVTAVKHGAVLVGRPPQRPQDSARPAMGAYWSPSWSCFLTRTERERVPWARALVFSLHTCIPTPSVMF